MPAPAVATLRALRIAWWLLPQNTRIGIANAIKGESLSRRVLRLALGLGCGAALIWTHLDTVPLTNRTRIMWLSQEETRLLDMAIAEEDGRTASEALPMSSWAVRRVLRILDELKAANTEELSSRPWSVRVLPLKEFNAASLPNGSLFLNEGLITKTKSDAELAFIVAHEMGHVVARHLYERGFLSNMLAVGANAVFWAIALATPDLAAVWWSELFTEYVMPRLIGNFAVKLPFERRQELEADRLGAIMAAKAGFNPLGAVAVCEKQAAEGPACEWESHFLTHPLWPERAQRLRDRMELEYHPIYQEALQHKRSQEAKLTLWQNVKLWTRRLVGRRPSPPLTTPPQLLT